MDRELKNLITKLYGDVLDNHGVGIDAVVGTMGDPYICGSPRGIAPLAWLNSHDGKASVEEKIRTGMVWGIIIEIPQDQVPRPGMNRGWQEELSHVTQYVAWGFGIGITPEKSRISARSSNIGLSSAEIRRALSAA